MPNKLPKHLILPDPHAHPAYDNDRFIALGRFIARERPDTIVCIGDFADMPSLSSYDRGKLSYEGRRYQDDCDAVLDAQNKMFSAMAAESNNGFQREHYRPRLVITLGNHEDRITRAVQDDPGLEEKLSIRDLGYESFGWKVFPFMQPAIINGIAYCHYFASGVA